MQNKTDVILLIFMVFVLLMIVARLCYSLNNKVHYGDVLEKRIRILEKEIDELHYPNIHLDKCRQSCEWHLVYMIETYAFIRNLSFILKKTDSQDGLGCEMDKYHQYLSGAIKAGLKVFPDNCPATKHQSVPATLRRYHHSSRGYLKNVFRGLI